MNKLYLFVFFVFASQIAVSQSINGNYKTEDGAYIIRIDKISDQFQGRILWLKNEKDATGAALKDINNPNERMRSLPVKGNKIIKELSYDQACACFTNGVYYNPGNGKSYNCEVKISSGTTLLLSYWSADNQEKGQFKLFKQ